MTRLSAIAFALLAPALIAGCAAQPPPALASLAPAVIQLGSIQEQMAAGRCDAGIAVRDLLQTPHAYAIGPLAGLRGELLIWDGTVFCSSFVDGAARVRIDPSVRAAFLVASHVKRWRDVAVPDAVVTLAELETWLWKTASELGLATDRPHTIRVFAGVTSAKLHVVDLPEGTVLAPTVLDHAAHEQARRPIDLGGAPAQLLGFLTPAGQSSCPIGSPTLHLHLRTLLGDKVGHVDDLRLSPGAKVEFAIR